MVSVSETTRLVDSCDLTKFFNPEAENGPDLREMILISVVLRLSLVVK